VQLLRPASPRLPLPAAPCAPHTRGRLQHSTTAQQKEEQEGLYGVFKRLRRNGQSRRLQRQHYQLHDVVCLYLPLPAAPCAPRTRGHLQVSTTPQQDVTMVALLLIACIMHQWLSAGQHHSTAGR
jgi:hypothetical protein